jgi:uncharacterized RDD family membrane protein YckC
MESINILTGQNVTIKYQPATILARVGALLLDYFLVFAYFFAITYMLFEKLDIMSGSTETWQVTIMVLCWLPAFGYHFLFESLLGGKTPGKMIVKIKVTNMDGSPAGIGAYFMRWILMPIDLFPSGIIGALFIIFSNYHQRIGDMAAGTVVVKTGASLLLDLDETYYEFPEDYQPTFYNVDLLTDGQIAFITNLLIEPQNKAAVNDSVAELSAKVKKLLNTESNLDNRKFLETILRDYNYYASLGI